MHRGELAAERYNEPVSAKTPLQGWSMNKSLMATFIGRQIDQGLLGLDDSVLEALERAGASGAECSAGRHPADIAAPAVDDNRL